MAEVLLRRHLETAGIEATVSSAGLYPGGSPATAHGVAAMADRGLDLSSHESRQLDASLIDGADLIIGMAREHVREVAVVDAGALVRTFTLKELVRAAVAAGPRRDGEDLGAWLERIGVGRQRASLLGTGHDPAMDIEDPVGRGRADYETTAEEIDDLLRRAVALAFPARAEVAR